METPLEKSKDNPSEDHTSQATPTMASLAEKQNNDISEDIISPKESADKKLDQPRVAVDETVYPKAPSAALIMFSCWLAMFLVALVGLQIIEDRANC
jgi:hypothetical protein